MPLLSIVTTVYDRADSLASCVRSVANLDFQDYEHIIVADHPPAEALAALEGVVREAADPRVRLYNMPERTNDLGISPAQTGLRQAQGRYVAFLDDDNVYLPSHFDALVACLEENPGLGFVYSACLWNAQLLLNAPSPSEGRIDLGQVLFRRELFKVQFDDELKYSGYTWDWQLIAELLSRSVAFRFIDQETFVFRAGQFPLLAPEAPLESARKRIAELVRAAQHARRDFTEATVRSQDEIVRLHREHERLSLAYRALDQERSALAGAHVDLQREHEAVALAHRGAADATRRAQDEIVRLQAEHERLSLAYRALEQERSGLAGAHLELQGEHERLSQAYRDLEQEHAEMASAHERLSLVHRTLELEHGERGRAQLTLQADNERLLRAHRELGQQLGLEIERLGGALRQRDAEVAMVRHEQAVAAEASAGRLAALQYRLDAVLASRAWRWTAPVRALLDLLGGRR